MKATYIDHMGTDLTVVNNARVSFDNESDWIRRCKLCDVEMTGQCGFAAADAMCPQTFSLGLSNRDRGLINFLARGCSKGDWEGMKGEVHMLGEDLDTDRLFHHLKSMPTHWAPFANGTNIQFHLKAPVPIMRQVFKHKAGSTESAGDVDAVESEESRRYVDHDPEVFYPEFRREAANVKQGSLPELLNDPVADGIYEEAMTAALEDYRRLRQRKVAPEQARMVLPQSAMLQVRRTNNLYGWWNFCNQRQDPHAQKEIQDLAGEIAEVCERLFPVSWNALETY